MTNPIQSAGRAIYRSTPAYLVLLGLSAAGGGLIGYTLGTSLNRMLTMSWCMASAHFCPEFNDDGSIDLMADKKYVAMMYLGIASVAIYAARCMHQLLNSSLPKEEQKIPTKVGKVSNRMFAAINDNTVGRITTMVLAGTVMAALGAALFTSMEQSYVTAWCSAAGIDCPEYDDQGNIPNWQDSRFNGMLGAGIGLGFLYGMFKAYQWLKSASEQHSQQLEGQCDNAVHLLDTSAPLNASRLV